MRAPNSVDFWRGFALATIFINHIPGVFLERYTFRHYSLSDAAELFVFLAGVSLRYVCNSLAKEPLSAAVYRLAGRALTIYFAQLVISAIAVAMQAGAAKALFVARGLALDSERLAREAAGDEVASILKAQADRARALSLPHTPSFTLGDFAFVGWPGVTQVQGFVESMRRCGGFACPGARP